MKQTMALAILDAGKSVFLTGPAGSGKTYVLNAFIANARKAGKSVAVTASTGIAATHLGGMTIHSWSGIGIADTFSEHMVKDMSKTRQDQIKKADILIIDEVSMLHDFRLDMVDRVCREVRANSEAFGGLQVVLSGDFYQLPPVGRDGQEEVRFVVDSAVWSEMDIVVCYLDEQYRQEDDMLLEILTALRENDLRRRHAEALLGRVQTDLIEDEDNPVTQLHTRNIDVDGVNRARLNAMDGEVHAYEMSHTGRASAVESLQKSCLAPELLELKTGAFVMFVKNATDRSYVNGTIGVVEGFDEDTDYPFVRTRDGRLVEVQPESWEMRDGERKIASLTQLPLRLAWAITIHKSQGMTLDAAYIDLRAAFVPGMGYVALSRVRSLDALVLAGFNRMAITMHGLAHELDQRFRKQSVSAEATFAALETAYLDKQQKAEQSATSVSKKGDKSGRSKAWQEKLTTMRKSYPNAFMPWKEEDDEKLKSAWVEGKRLQELTDIFGRHPGSIRSRLKKHFGDSVLTKEK